jgi:hypothetical protein
LERVGEVEFPRGARGTGQRVVDALEEKLVIPDVVEPDVGQPGDGNQGNND